MKHLAPQIIVICGLPGTGKSPLSEAVAKALNAPILSTDNTRLRLGYQGRYEAEEKSVIYDAFFAEALEEGEETPVMILDGSFSTPSSRVEAIALGRKLQRPVLFFHIIAEEANIKRRLVDERENGHDDFAVYQRMKADFTPFNFPVHVIDTTVDCPTVSSNRLLNVLKAVEGEAEVVSR
ncbi:MAG: AAA family ATPase [Bacteroidia bacterium]